MNFRNTRSGATTLLGAVLIATTAVCVTAGDTVIRLSPARVAELAATQSLAIKASELSIKAQEQARMSAFTGFLPSVSGTGSATHLVTQPKIEFGGGGATIADTTDPVTRMIMGIIGGMFSGDMAMSPTNIYSVGLTISQPIFTGGKILNAWRIQKQTLEAQKFTLERTRGEMRYAALSLYWGYIASLKGLEASTETRKWFETLVADQRKMYENGLIIELDVLNSKIQLDNFTLLEMKMTDMIGTLGGQLLMLLGLPADAVIEADTSNLRSEEAASLQVSADSLEAWLAVRGDLKAMRCQLDMMHTLEKIQKAAYAPTIAGFANLSYSNQYSMTDETSFDNTSAFGLSLNWPIFDWGKGIRETRKVRFQADALALQIENMGDQVRLKKLELARKVAQSERACAIAREDVAIATRALDIARTKYDAQAITSTELLTARNQLTSKTFAYTQACINVKLALEEYALAPLSAGQAQPAASSSSESAGSASPSR